MKILQICAAYKPAYIYGGPTMSVSMLSEQLVNAGINLEVYATTANGKTELQVEPGKPQQTDGVTVTYFKRITKDHSHFSPALLKTLWINIKRFDVVHIHAWWNLVSVFSCLIALLRNVPVIVSTRGTLSPYSFKNKNIGFKWVIHRFAGKYLLRKCLIHVTSEREKDAVAKLLQYENMVLIPNFVKLPAIKFQAVRKTSNNLRLLFLSRIEQKKGLEILVQALHSLSVPYTLSIIGNGDKDYVDDLKALAQSHHVDDKIIWMGFKNAEKFKLLYDHDLFILPSYDENFGNAVIESLAVGTPVLISEEVGLAGYVMKNNLGWICKTNAASVSTAINKIARLNPDEIKRIRECAPDIVYRDFNKHNLVKAYVDMYNNKIKK